MSQQQRLRLTHAFALTLKILGAGTIALSLGACTELARFVSKPEAKSEEAIAAEEAAATAPVAEAMIENPVKPQPSKLYEWKGDGRPVSRIVIDTDAQRARFFAGEDEVGWSTVASGLPKHPTPTGQFAVIEKVENKRSNLYGKVVKGDKVLKSNAKSGRDPIPAGARFEGAHMPYFMRLTNDGIGLHAGPIPRPGQPASHGCIRLPSNLAPVLFQHVPHGVQVTIVGSGPSYGNYIQKQRVAEAQRVAREAEQRRVAERKAAEEAEAGVADLSEGTAASRSAQAQASLTDQWVDPSVPTLSNPRSAQESGAPTSDALALETPANEPTVTATPPSTPAVAPENGDAALVSPSPAAPSPTPVADTPEVSMAETTSVAAPQAGPTPVPTQAAPSAPASVVGATPALPKSPRLAEPSAAAPLADAPMSTSISTPANVPASLPANTTPTDVAPPPQPASVPPPAAASPAASPEPAPPQPVPQPAQALQPPAADPAGSEG